MRETLRHAITAQLTTTTYTQPSAIAYPAGQFTIGAGNGAASSRNILRSMLFHEENKAA